jgi:excisionase family DNA binding protein
MTRSNYGAGEQAPQLLKVADVSRRLGVGIDWVYDRINRGEIPVVELGDTRKNQRIRESDLAAFINERTFGKRESHGG